MRNLQVALLLLLVPVAQTAPKVGEHRPEDPKAMRLDHDPDPLSTELPTLLLLRNVARSLGLPPEWDAEAMTREQVLLFLFVLHDHDRSRQLDGLELLQLLGTVLAQQEGGWPDLNMVAVLVDRVLERQDLSRDGLLDPPELLFLPHWDHRPPEQPNLQQPGELQAGAGAVPRLDTETPGENTEVGAPGHGQEEEQAAPQVEASDVEVMEVEEVHQTEGPDTEGMEAKEVPEAGALEREKAPV
ncbi:cell growth regulator with EF hand domain protein 1 [Melanerpes formicivorus]|uniref:cell growth regulator with EF hand domain protein 1 n=1 Tax=Melanerpes formicivorus TaxID=211600 RepID=UPI00358ED263